MTSHRTKEGARIALGALEKRVADLDKFVPWPALTASWRADLETHKALMRARGWL